MKVIHELIGYFERRGKLTPKMMEKLVKNGFFASEPPSSLTELCQQVGETFYFKVTGQEGGSIWGTDTYTGDSNLPTAAVHAGAVDAGDTSVVRVTVVAPLNQYQGTTRHGITSAHYGPYGTAYRVEAV
jgi:hypothetical protein